MEGNGNVGMLNQEEEAEVFELASPQSRFEERKKAIEALIILIFLEDEGAFSETSKGFESLRRGVLDDPLSLSHPVRSWFEGFGMFAVGSEKKNDLK